MRKTKNSILTLGALLAAATAGVSGQDTTPAASTTNAVPEKAAAPATQAGDASASKSAVHFEGTDLKLGRLPAISFHGFASQGLIASTEYNYLGKTKSGLGSPEFNEFGLNASMSPFPRTRIAAQVFTFDLGNVGNYDVVLDYGSVEYTFCDELGIRAGRVRRPSGIYNSIQDIDLARTSILLPQGVYDGRNRDYAASVDGGSGYGSVGLGKLGSFSYEAYGGMVNLSEEGGLARRFQDIQNNTPGNYYKQVSGFPLMGAQFWWMTPLQGLRAGAGLSEAFGFSYDYFARTRGDVTYEADVPTQLYSLEYQIKSWTFQAEYRTQNSSSHTIDKGGIFGRSRNRNAAWYLGAAYRFNKWLEAGSYYTEFYSNAANSDGKGTAVPSNAFQKDGAFSLRFDPKPWWTMKLELHALTGTALLYDLPNNRVRNDDVWYMLAAKTTFSF
jgi:hypothetical protein